MSVRIRPEEIEAPPKDPFKYDLLDRKKPAEAFTSIVTSFEGPAVVAIDSPWGMGKTTFLKMWTQHLRDQKLAVVAFNAWETDFAEHPFLALATELQLAFEEMGDAAPVQEINRLARVGKKILRPILTAAVLQAVPGAALASDTTKGIVDSLFDQIADSSTSEYRKQKQAIVEFRSTLEVLARSVSEKSDGCPLIVVIDELDRCRPTYAVNLLEAAKHLFSVRHVVFVLAINRSQLIQSICSLYGNGFDADTYLRRFIDTSTRLRDPTRDKIITASLERIGLKEIASTSNDRNAAGEFHFARELLLAAFGAPVLDTRTVLQCFLKLEVVLKSIRSDHAVFLYVSSLSIVLHAYDEALYQSFVNGTASDTEIIEAIRKGYGGSDWRNENWTAFFEAVVIRTITGQAFESRTAAPRTLTYNEYKKLVEDSEGGERLGEDYHHAKSVVDRIAAFGRGWQRHPYSAQLKFVAERMNLLSESFVHDTEEVAAN